MTPMGIQLISRNTDGLYNSLSRDPGFTVLAHDPRGSIRLVLDFVE